MATIGGNLACSGTTTLNNSTICISSLNVSGLTTFSNNVGIGTIIANHQLHLHFPTDDKLLLVLNAGLGTFGTARSIGQPLLGVGGDGFGGSIGDYYGIGLRYIH